MRNILLLWLLAQTVAQAQNLSMDMAPSPWQALQSTLVEGQRQTFLVNPAQPSTVRAARGTEVKVPAGSLVFADGSVPKGPITLEVREALTPGDWFSQQLSTLTTDGQLLQTGGMLQVSASSEGKPLQVKKGKSLRVEMPAFGGKAQPDMQIFYGQTHHADGPTTWNLAANATAVGTPRPKLGDQAMRNLFSAFLATAKVPETKPQLPTFNGRILLAARGRRPRAPRPLPAPPAAPAATQKAYTALSIAEKTAVKQYEQRMAYYRSAFVRAENAWERYRRDSTKYAQAKTYQKQCQGQLIQYEDSSFMYLLAKTWNQVLDRYQDYPLQMKDLKAIAKGEKVDGYSTFLQLRNNPEYRGTAIKLNDKRAAVDLERIPAYNYFYAKKIKDKPKWYQFKARKDPALYGVRWHRQRWESHFKSCSDSLLATWGTPLLDTTDLQRKIEIAATENVDGLMHYSFNVEQLDWVNIDRFLKTQNLTEQVLATVETPKDTRVFLYCPSIQGALWLEGKGQRFESPRLPKDVPVKLVALQLRDGAPALCIREVTTGTEAATAVHFEFEPVTLETLKSALATL